MGFYIIYQSGGGNSSKCSGSRGALAQHALAKIVQKVTRRLIVAIRLTELASRLGWEGVRDARAHAWRHFR